MSYDTQLKNGFAWLRNIFIIKMKTKELISLLIKKMRASWSYLPGPSVFHLNGLD